MKEDLINRIYDDKKNYIEENLDEFLDSLTTSRKKALERWLDMNNYDDKIKEVKEQIKLLLYNKKEVPIGTQLMIENDEDESIYVQSKKKIGHKTMKSNT